MSFPGYERYKDSGVEWLNAVPAHWNVVPVRAIVEHVDKRNDGVACKDYLSLMANIGVIPYAEKGDIGNKMPEDLSKCKLVTVGDIVINSMNYSIGSYGMSGYSGVCSPVYVVLRAKEEIVEKQFAFRIFQNVAFQRYAASFGNGILAHRAAIGWDDLKAIGIALPPANEQIRILSFLNQETAKIDALIEEQRRLIELLKEKRQAVISHAVTKGLNSGVPMKVSRAYSGLRCPAHWTPYRVKRLILKIEQGWSPQCDNFPAEGSEWGVLKVGAVNSGIVDARENKRLPEHVGAIPALSIHKGDVLVSRANTRELVGSAAIADQDHPRLLLCDKLYRLDVDSGFCSSHFLSLFLRTSMVRGMIEADATGASQSMQNIGQDSIMNLFVELPSLPEQLEIVSAITTQQQRLSELIESGESSVRLLQERRSALISAAVTGKIDVRNYTSAEACA